MKKPKHETMYYMRTINKIIIHCSDTPEGMDIGAKEIDRWHQQRGFKRIGYHYVIRLNGQVEEGRQLKDQGAHCEGHNAHSVGICYVGGLDTQRRPCDTRTPQQKESLRHLVAALQVMYPKATIHGHNEFARKACPCFDVRAEFGRV